MLFIVLFFFLFSFLNYHFKFSILQKLNYFFFLFHFRNDYMCFEFLLYLNLTYDSNREDIHVELCYYIILLTKLNFLFMQLN